MQRISIGFRENSDGLDAHSAQSPNYPARDGSAVGDQYL
jgi:hypothetical protein